MYRPKRTALAALMAAVVSGCAGLEAVKPSIAGLNPFDRGPAGAELQAKSRSKHFWTRASTDLTPDPAVRTGVLPTACVT